jgi:cytochrome c biogenesis protein CcmG/thiol:disulfide interchange protein DsbE
VKPRDVLEPVAAGLVCFLAVVAIWHLAGGSANANGSLDANAPDFTVAPLSGDTKIRLSNMAGRLIVLNFFASWCGPCKDEAKGFARTAATYGGDIVSFVGVDVRDAVSDARRFVTRYGIKYAVGHDNAEQATTLYGVGSLPATFIISPQGRVVDHLTGFVSEAELRVRIRHALAATT